MHIRVDGNHEGLRLGSTTKVKIITKKDKNAITVPLSAIYEEGGKKKVLVIDNGTIQAREVKVASESDFSAAISSGLKEGETVITRRIRTRTWSACPPPSMAPMLRKRTHEPPH